MKRAQKFLSITLAFLFVFVVFGFNTFAASKVVKPKVVVSIQPKTQYFEGERISLSVKAPNYKGKVQYRIHIRNSKGQIVKELFAKYPGKYYNKQISAQGNFNVGFSITESGTYYAVVYVKRVGAKVYYDSYAVTRKFVVKAKVSVEEPKEEPGVLNLGINTTIDALWAYEYVSDRYEKPTLNNLGYSNGAYNYAIDLKIKKEDIKTYTVAQSYDIFRNKFLSFGKLDEQNQSDAKTSKVISTANTLKTVLGNIEVKVGANDSFKNYNQYLIEILQNKGMINAKAFLESPNAATYNALYYKIASDSKFESLPALIPYVYLLTNGDVTYEAIKVYGINVESISVNNKVVYGLGNDKTIAKSEITMALGISVIQTAKIGDFVNKPVKIVLNDGNYKYVYTVTLK